MGRRLFDNLQQRVEAACRHHVGLVDDENLEAVASWRKHGALAQVARVINAAVARSVDLDNVKGAATGAAELDAARAGAAGGVRWPLSAVQAASKNARAGRLTAAARAAEQVRVPDAPSSERSHERISHLRLPNHLGE